MEDYQLLIDLHKRSNRQGPGGDAESEKALSLAMIDVVAPLKRADIGCGTSETTAPGGGAAGGCTDGQPATQIPVTYVCVHLAYRINLIIKLKVNGARITVGIRQDQGDITHVTEIGRVITGERRITGITRGVADERSHIFLAVFHTVTVQCIIDTGIIPPYAEAALALVNLGAEKSVITGCSIIGM